jgi:hypothetical protein
VHFLCLLSKVPGCNFAYKRIVHSIKTVLIRLGQEVTGIKLWQFLASAIGSVLDSVVSWICKFLATFA